MSVQTEIIALGIRVLSEKTSLIRKPDAFEAFLNQFLGMETYDRRLAKEIESEAQRVTEAVKRFRTKRQFNKIVQNV